VKTGWTESVAVRNKAQIHVFEAIRLARSWLPFPLLGMDSDMRRSRAPPSWTTETSTYAYADYTHVDAHDRARQENYQQPRCEQTCASFLAHSGIVTVAVGLAAIPLPLFYIAFESDDLESNFRFVHDSFHTGVAFSPSILREPSHQPGQLVTRGQNLGCHVRGHDGKQATHPVQIVRSNHPEHELFSPGEVAV